MSRAAFLGVVASFAMISGHVVGAERGFCATITSVLSVLETEPEGLRGERVTASYSKATRTLPNASECFMWDDGEYTCEWATATPKRGVQQFREFAAALVGCYPEPAGKREADTEIQLRVKQPGNREVTIAASWDRNDLKIEVRLQVVR